MHDEGHISEKNRNYLLIDQPKAGRFYLLPKIHKAGNPGRPIVSANGHPTEKISEFVDLHLQPHVQNLPSYLKDTTDFLRKQDAQAPFPPDTLLVSMDVTSLYTNIPHQDGIQACEEVWEERKVMDPPTQTLVKRLTLILKCNNFEFNGNIISRSKALLLVPKWHLHTPTFSWVVSRNSCWSRWPWDHFHG